MARETELLRQL